MSAASRKGYSAEHAAELWLEEELGIELERPRAGALLDRGDLVGMPMTVSVKNQATLRLAVWTDEMAGMVAVNRHQAGVVLHKRKGKGQPDDWYVTTSGGLWLPMARAYLGTARGPL